MDANKLPGPYRATKLWNEAICLFRNGMPMKRHRKHIRLYDNCFTGGEAINWLHHTLQENPNFGHDVTREKTAQLLNKFFKVGVFQTVSSGSSDSLGNFKESELYQFCSRSPLRNLKISALASLNNQQLQKDKWLARSNSKCNVDNKLPKRSSSFQSNFMEEVKSKAASNQLKQMEIEEVWKTVVLGRLQALLGALNVDDVLPSNQTSGLWIMKNACPVDGQPLHHSINRSQLFPRWILAAMKSLIDWPHHSGNASCSFQYSGFEKDVFKVIRDYFSNLELPLITCFLYSAFVNSYAYVEYMEAIHCNDSTEVEFQNMNCEIPSKSLENLVLNMTSDVKDSHGRPQSICSYLQTGKTTKSLNASNIGSVSSAKDFTSNKSVVDNASLAECNDRHGDISGSIDDVEFVNANKLFSAALPPNTCFETAFTSESPVTRIIPRKLVENIHWSHKNRYSRSLSRNPSFAVPYTSLEQPINTGSIPNHSYFYKIKRNSSAPNLIDSNNFVIDHDQLGSKATSSNNAFLNATDSSDIGMKYLHDHMTYSNLPDNTKSHPLLYSQDKLKKSQPEVHEQHSKRRRKKMSSENVSNKKLHHIRNKSGGYVNLAMSCTADELNKSEGFDQLLGEVLDYDAALETLQKLMKCAASYDERKDLPEPKVTCDELGNQSYSSASSLWSYHTADSGDHSCQARTPVTRSNFHVDKDHRNWASINLMNSGVLTLQWQQLGIEVLQLLLLLLPPVNRYKLNLLLCFMSNISDNGRLTLQDGVCTKTLLLDTFTSSILQPELSEQGDEILARRLVGFFLDNCEALFQVPSGLKAEVDSHLAQMSKQEEYTSPIRAPVTYCEQISCQQYEQQKLTGSQLALTELLEQIIVDAKMGSKEKKKRLKMFKEAYPHIYFRRFPDNYKEDGGQHSKPKGILRFTSLSRLRNLRI